MCVCGCKYSMVVAFFSGLGFKTMDLVLLIDTFSLPFKKKYGVKDKYLKFILPFTFANMNCSLDSVTCI